MHIFFIEGGTPLVMAHIHDAGMEFFKIDTGFVGDAGLRSNLFERLQKRGELHQRLKCSDSVVQGGD